MSDPTPTKHILAYYRQFDEHGRLTNPWGELERLRTQRILKRHLPSPPLSILDVGGGTGPYSFWLAKCGYDVHLFDPVPELIEKAKEIALTSEHANPKSIQVGDARNIEFSSDAADAVLFSVRFIIFNLPPIV